MNAARRSALASCFLVIGCLACAAAVSAVRTTTLLDFDTAAEIELFRPIDDVVMGGRSSSRLDAAAPGIARFSGQVSLANNGGFASIRSVSRDWQLDGATALVLRARGDARSYKLTVRVDDGFDGLQYQARFTPTPDWSQVRLPMNAFVASFRGRPVAGAPPLDPARIRAIGLMISDKQAGAFELLVDRLAAEYEPQAPPR